LVGAIVGGAAGSDKKFDLAERDLEQCRSLIEKLINKAKKKESKEETYTSLIVIAFKCIVPHNCCY
jgi:hypothetical protein